MKNFTLTFGSEEGSRITLATPQYQFKGLEKNEGERERTQYIFISEDGLLGTVKADLQSIKVPFRHGERLIDVMMEAKHFQVQFEVRAKDYEELEIARDKIERIFNPMNETMVFYESDDVKRVLITHAEHVPDFPVSTLSNNRSQIITVNLTAFNPYWQSVEMGEFEMTAFVPLFEFPSDFWEVPHDIFEIGMEGTERIIKNDGLIPVPVTITIKGPSTNPVISNLTTGEKIHIKANLSESDIMVIDTSVPTVKINNENAFHLLDLESRFWNLVKGENVVTYTADAGQEEAKVEIVWRSAYGSV